MIINFQNLTVAELMQAINQRSSYNVDLRFSYKEGIKKFQIPLNEYTTNNSERLVNLQKEILRTSIQQLAIHQDNFFQIKAAEVESFVSFLKTGYLEITKNDILQFTQCAFYFQSNVLLHELYKKEIFYEIENKDDALQLVLLIAQNYAYLKEIQIVSPQTAIIHFIRLYDLRLFMQNESVHTCIKDLPEEAFEILLIYIQRILVGLQGDTESIQMFCGLVSTYFKQKMQHVASERIDYYLLSFLQRPIVENIFSFQVVDKFLTQDTRSRVLNTLGTNISRNTEMTLKQIKEYEQKISELQQAKENLKENLKTCQIKGYSLQLLDVARIKQRQNLKKIIRV